MLIVFLGNCQGEDQVANQREFDVGDKIEAQQTRGERWRLATVVELHISGGYVVIFDDSASATAGVILNEILLRPILEGRQRGIHLRNRARKEDEPREMSNVPTGFLAVGNSHVSGGGGGAPR